MGELADPRQTLMRYLRVQKQTDVEVRQLLRRAARDLAAQIENLAVTGYGDQVRLAQLKIRQRVIAEELWLRVGARTRVGSSRAVDAALKGGDKDLRELLRHLPANARATLIEGAEKAAREAVDRAVMRSGGRAAIELSHRVYRNRDLMTGRVDRMINSGLARGLSPAELAAEVKRYILPSTPGGASYAAERLARTEINNSFHSATVAYYEDNPFVGGMKWYLSGSHPKADECDQYAHEDSERLGAGVFRTNNVPSKPHPHCFCYVAPTTPDDDEIVAAYARGDYNEFLAGQGFAAPDPIHSARPFGR